MRAASWLEAVLSMFDIDALRIVERALALSRPVLISPADPFAPVSALVAAAAHIASMVQERRASGLAMASRLHVAVVTSAYRLRGFYRGLAVTERRGVGGVPMKSIVPTATLASDGQLRVVDSEDGRWSTVFVRSVAEAMSLRDLDLLVVDLPVVDADLLSTISVPTVVIARDPSDAAVGRLARSMPVFGYDGFLTTESVLSAGGDTGLRLMNRLRQHSRIVPVCAPTVCSNASLFWQDIGWLVRLSRRSPYAARLTREAFGLFHDLLGLAMPVESFGLLTGSPLRQRLRELALAARRLADTALRGDWLPMIDAELSGLLAALENPAGPAADGGSTKASVLKQVVADALDDRRDVLVVARTAALARAYSEHLRIVGLGDARVTSLGALADDRPADVAVLLGMAPTWARWVYRAGAGQELVVLGYTDTPHPLRPAPSAADTDDAAFDEVRIVAAAMNRQTSAGLHMSGAVQRSRAWSALVSGIHDGQGLDDGSVDAAGESANPVVSPQPPPEDPPGLWDGTGWTSDIESEIESDTTPAGDVNKVAPGARVTFADGSWAWLCHDTQVWRWRRHTGTPRQIRAAELMTGDEIALVDDGAHRTLLGKILNAAEEIPELAVASGWLEHWRAMLRRAHTQFGSYAALTHELVRLGCSVQVQTVRLWCIGETIGPEDPGDVRRLGQLLGDPVLSDHHMKVWQAMRTLRGAHVKLGRRLATLIRSLGPAVGQRGLLADEIVDTASGLTAADLESAVVLLKVTEVVHAPAVPCVLSGTRHDANEPVDVITDSRAFQERES